MESFPANLLTAVRGEDSIFFFLLGVAVVVFLGSFLYRAVGHWLRHSRQVSPTPLLDAKVDLGWAIVPALVLALLTLVVWPLKSGA